MRPLQRDSASPHALEGAEPYPKQYAYVCYAMPSDLLAVTPNTSDTSAVGVDRNLGKCKDSQGTVNQTPHTNRTNRTNA